MIWRGCKRCFGPREQRSPKSPSASPKTRFALVQLSFAPVQGVFGALESRALTQKKFCTLTTFRNFPFSGPLPGPLGRKLKTDFSETAYLIKGQFNAICRTTFSRFWKATVPTSQRYQIRDFRLCFRAPFPPSLFPSFFPPLSPSGPVCSPTTSPVFASPFIPFFDSRKTPS